MAQAVIGSLIISVGADTRGLQTGAAAGARSPSWHLGLDGVRRVSQAMGRDRSGQIVFGAVGTCTLDKVRRQPGREETGCRQTLRSPINAYPTSGKGCFEIVRARPFMSEVFRAERAGRREMRFGRPGKGSGAGRSGLIEAFNRLSVRSPTFCLTLPVGITTIQSCDG